jgi:colicin import membrane protein
VSAATLPDHAEARRRGLRWTLLASTVGHAVLAGLLIWTPSFRARPVRMPSVLTVELVAAPPAAKATPRPVPKPPPPPAPRKVVLPSRPTRAAAPVPAEPVVRRPEPPPEESYEDLLEKLRANAGEARPDPVEVARRTPPPPRPEPTPAPQVQPLPTATPRSGGPGRPAPPEVVAWLRDARIHVRREWVLAPGFRLQPLETHVEVSLDAGGRVVGEPEITRRSGNPWYDESVVRAIQKSSPLPAPPEAGDWPFVFRPEDY